jgi:hypothetical protein
MLLHTAAGVRVKLVFLLTYFASVKGGASLAVLHGHKAGCA